MKQIPQPTKVRYDALLTQHRIPKKLHPYYLKWLRYYLDFCRKYNFKEADKKSLPYFIKKLKAKNKRINNKIKLSMPYQYSMR